MNNNELVRAAGAGIAIALVLVTVGYFVADAVSGPLAVTMPGSESVEEIAVGQVLFFTVLGGAAGLGLALGARRLSRPRAAFITISVVALMLYGVMPFTAAEETSTAIWLNILHVLAAVPIVGSVSRRLPDDRVRSGDLLEATTRSTQ